MDNMHTNENYYRNRQPPSASTLLNAMSPEELAVWTKCNKDAIYSAGLPAAVGCGGTVYYAMKTGMFKPHARFGSLPGVLGAACFGYMIARFSYSTVCLEKVMAVPDSNIRKIFMESIPQISPVDRQYPTLEAPADIVQSVQRSSLDLDTYQPPSTLDGFISSNNSDMPINTDDDLSDESNLQSKPSVTYAELRDKNRQDFMRNRDRRMSSSLPPISRPAPPSDVEMNIPPVRRNKYGDVWD